MEPVRLLMQMPRGLKLAQSGDVTGQVVHAGDRVRMSLPQDTLSSSESSFIQDAGASGVVQRSKRQREGVHRDQRMWMVVTEQPMSVGEHLPEGGARSDEIS